jgi:hypothetical protein
MHGPFFPGLPSWVLLLAVSALIVLIAVFAPGPRAPPPRAPADYDRLRELYEPVERLTGAAFCLGVFWGFALGLELDYRRLHYGLAAGTAGLMATGSLALSIRMKPERSLREYLRYGDLHHAGPLRLPAITYIYLLVGFITWGVISLALLAFGP